MILAAVDGETEGTERMELGEISWRSYLQPYYGGGCRTVRSDTS